MPSQGERPALTLRSLAQWLVAMDEPDSSQRRTVTLTQIIDEARAALESDLHSTDREPSPGLITALELARDYLKTAAPADRQHALIHADALNAVIAALTTTAKPEGEN